MAEINQSNPNRQGIDRLSSLSESIVSHILSFLPTKLAVATSILARKWRFFWTQVPNLDFKTDKPSNSLLEQNEPSKNIMCLSDIVNTVLMLHNARCLDSFRLELVEEYNKNQFDCWMRTLVARKIKQLDLRLEFNGSVHLPPCIFTCETLVVLKLSNDVFIPEFRIVRLPRLKTLCLNAVVVYENDRTLPLLISGCLILNDLTVIRWSSKVDGMFCCEIYSSTLESLRLHFGDDSNPSSHKHRLKINTPALRFLHLVDTRSKYVSAGELPSLIEASIHVWEDGGEYLISGLKLVEGLHKAKVLQLCTNSFINVRSLIFHVKEKFHNLTKLELPVDWEFLKMLLEVADNLKELIIGGQMVHVDDEDISWKEPSHIPKSLLFCLKTVTIQQFRTWREYEFAMVKYIPRNGGVLTRMGVHHFRAKFESNTKFEELHQLPRGSTTCELVLRKS